MNELADPRRRIAEVNASETQFRQAEEALREIEEKYRHLFAQSPVGIGLSSTDGKVVSSNRAMEAITGYSIKELKEINLADTYANPEDRKALLEAINRYGWVVNYPMRLKRKDGTPYDALLTISWVHHLGDKDFFQTICVDVTESKRVERELLESEAKYRALTEHSPDIIMRFDRHYRILYMNPAVTSALAVVPQDSIGKTHRELGFLEDMCSYWEEKIQKVFDTGLPLNEVFEYEGKADRVIFDWQLVPEFGADGCVEMVLSTARDITEQKQVERALKQREKELEIKTSSLEEVNTALKVLLKRIEEHKLEIEESVLFNMKELIVPCIEKLKEGTLDEKQRAYVNSLESNLNDIISPFSRRLSSTYWNFTPAEKKVANLVRYGKTTKEIAEFLYLSGKTIEVHRRNIRRKIGIKNKKVNLRSHLLSIQ